MIRTEICQMFFAPFIAALVVNFEAKTLGKHRTLLTMAVLPLAFISTFLWYVVFVSHVTRLFLRFFAANFLIVIQTNFNFKQKNFYNKLLNRFPVAFSYAGKVAYYFFMIVLYNLFLALLLIAYESMVPLLSDDDVDIVQINSLRLMFGSATNIGVILTALLVFNVVVQSVLLYIFLSIITSSFLLYIFSVLVIITEEDAVPLDPAVAAERAHLKPMSQLFRSGDFGAIWDRLRKGFAYQFGLFKDRKFMALFINTGLFWCQWEISAAMLPIFVKDYLHINIKTMFPSMETAFVIGILVLYFFQSVSQIVIAIFADYVSVNKLFIGSLAVMTVEKVFLSFMFSIGIPNWTVYAMLALEGLALGAAYSALETMVSELVIYDQKQHGEMRSVLVYGWVDSFREISIAFGILLDSFGVENFKQLKVSSTANALFLFFSCLVPALLAILMILVANWQPLDAETLRPDEHNSQDTELEIRKKTDGDEDENAATTDDNGNKYDAVPQSSDEELQRPVKRPETGATPTSTPAE